LKMPGLGELCGHDFNNKMLQIHSKIKDDFQIKDLKNAVL